MKKIITIISVVGAVGYLGWVWWSGLETKITDKEGNLAPISSPSQE
jgi:hypothetical protein